VTVIFKISLNLQAYKKINLSDYTCRVPAIRRSTTRQQSQQCTHWHANSYWGNLHTNSCSRILQNTVLSLAC